MKKLIFRNHQSPGDLIMLIYGLKSLHECRPGKYLTDVRTSTPDIFLHSPYVTPIDDDDPDARVIDIGYPSIHQSNERPVHFVTSFTHEIGRVLGERITPTTWADAITISEEEKSWYSAVYEKIGRDVPFWVICCGHKFDFTAKAWDFDRYQQIIDECPDVWFVQVGLDHPFHVHPRLKGDNLINLVGQTDTRQLIRLVYNSFGVITPVSFPMLLAYSVPAHPRFGRKSRGCIVIAGGREPNTWQQGPNQHYLHSCGMLDCSDCGGCWRSRVVPLGDGDPKDEDLCLNPVQTKSGQWIGKCMDQISVSEVTTLLDKYMANLDYEPRS